MPGLRASLPALHLPAAAMTAEIGVSYVDDPREYRRQYARAYRRGLRRPVVKRSVLLRLLDRLNHDPGEPLITDPDLLEELGWCWPWYGALNSDGYGVIAGDDGQLVLVHRVALTTALNRPIREGLFACHKCNVRHCARPRHLYEGTKEENEADKRGRSWGLVNPPKPLAVP